MREINFEKCKKYMVLVKDLVDDVWISKELEKINS